MAKIGVEPSEVMTSVAMLMTNTNLKKYSKDANGLKKFIQEGKKIAKSNKVVYATGTKEKFLKAFDSNDKDFLIAAAQGISAANAIKEWAPVRSRESGTPIAASDIPIKVFLTGDSWPDEVKKFQIAAYGFKSYNSSDLIVQWRNPKGLSFYGVSLKKKPSPTAPNPTLINKAFDSVLEGESAKEIEQLNKIKKDIEEARIKYFAKVFREAVSAGYLKIKGSIPASDKAIWDTKVYGEVQGKNGWKAKEKIPLINLKGRGTLDLSNPLKQKDPNIFQIYDKGSKKYREFQRGELRDKKLSMRAFVNGKLGSNDSIFNAMVKVMNKYSDKFAVALLNLVLKTKLYNELDENTFAFSLVEGVGDIDKDGNPKIGRTPAKGLYTVLCGLSALNKGNTKYEMILNNARNRKEDGEEGAAKVWLILKKGTMKILDLQLKYKGNFLGQPQFGATMTDEFKEVLKEQWGKKCKVY
tara:strand:- start:530 stop:1933 length:1404 start_codon:yes stop_codon:yes gene_type:complete